MKQTIKITRKELYYLQDGLNCLNTNYWLKAQEKEDKWLAHDSEVHYHKVNTLIEKMKA